MSLRSCGLHIATRRRRFPTACTVHPKPPSSARVRRHKLAAGCSSPTRGRPARAQLPGTPPIPERAIRSCRPLARPPGIAADGTPGFPSSPSPHICAQVDRKHAIEIHGLQIPGEAGVIPVMAIFLPGRILLRRDCAARKRALKRAVAHGDLAAVAALDVGVGAAQPLRRGQGAPLHVLSAPDRIAHASLSCSHLRSPADRSRAPCPRVMDPPSRAAARALSGGACGRR
jgi:hypothetical protein